LVLLATGGALVMSASLVDECYRRAREARRSAEIASMATQKTHFLELEQRWLLAATSVAPETARETKAIAEPKIANVLRGRPTKFTPERIEQIRGLVALGKSREEIAGLLGVTVGSLQVTCSKLGISLRPRRLDPTFNAQLNLPNHGVPRYGDSTKVNSMRFTFEQVDEVLQRTQEEEPGAPRPDEIERPQVDGADLALKMHYRNREQILPLHLSNELISALALEAQIREMSLGQLVGAIIEGAMTEGVSRMFDGGPSGNVAVASETGQCTSADRE
jgi:hypothetical protein